MEIESGIELLDRPATDRPVGERDPEWAATSWARQLWRAARSYPMPLVALVLLLASGVLWLAGRSDIAQWALLAIIVLGGVPLLWETLSQILHREFGVDLIAILAIGGSAVLHQYLAGAFIVLMLSGGGALEAYALRRARSSLSSLAERAPRTAHIWDGTHLMDVAAEDVAIGQCVVVKPGELIPIDGVVISGSSNVSEADLTGEPTPSHKEPSALVMSGSVNLDGVLEARATRRSSDSQYAQIVRLVEAAQKQKAPIHRLADRYGVWFTVIAVVMAGAAWMISRDSLFALAVLVVATPCPLILATPIAIMSGIDVAAHRGLIVKSGATIEQLGEVDVAVFDKTGTLTLGTPKLVELVQRASDSEWASMRDDEETLLRLAASVEQLSSHVLARAAVERAREQKLALLPATDFEEVPGNGIRARLPVSDGADREVAVGNRAYMRAGSIEIPALLLQERDWRTAQGQIVSFLAIDQQVVALLVFADVPRPELARLAPALKSMGITQTVLLTGDGTTVAEQVGAMAQVDRVVAHCLPEHKVEVVAALQSQGHKVLMVGDGVNDAPALATANVGVAMGAQGLTAAAAVADGVLLSSDILQVASAVRLGRRVLRVALQGIWAGMGLSLVAMLFAAFGFIPPAAGAILQEGIDVLVILNALRAGRV